MINKRLFGSDIDARVKAILEARQRVAKDPNPTQSVQFTDITGEVFETNVKDSLKNINFKTGEDGALAYLSSKTPFTRLWTSVSLIKDVSPGDEEYKVIIPDLNDQNYHSTLRANKQAAKSLAEQNGNIGDSYVVYDNVRNVYIVKKPLAVEEEAGKVYVLGNYNLDTLKAPGSPQDTNITVGPFEQGIGYSGAPTNGTSTSTTSAPEPGIGQRIFPNEHQSIDKDLNEDRNQFLKPQAGITSVSSTTEGSIGVIKKTSINFVVHNFHDYENIFQRYFLRPGAQLFLDFGWDTADLYDPNALIKAIKNDELDFERFLYGEGQTDQLEDLGIITKSMGNLETLVGIVTNYNSKVLENGSIECSVEMTSKNSALLGNVGTSQLSSRIKYVLDNVIYYDAIYKISTESYCAEGLWAWTEKRNPTGGIITTENECNTSGGHWMNGGARNLLQSDVPGTTWGADHTFNFNKELINMVWSNSRSFVNDSFIPKGDAIATGLYIYGDNKVGKSDTHAVYITWGLFEDLILNFEFGHGASKNNIDSGNNLEVRIDSSNSFTTFSKELYERQMVLSQVHREENQHYPKFLYPHTEWSESDREVSDIRGVEDANTIDYFYGWDDTYSTRQGKSPTLDQYENLGFNDNSDPDDNEANDKKIEFNGRTDFDVELGRVPLREIYIRTDVILEHVKEFDGVPKMINEILHDINEDSFDIFDWKIATTGLPDTKVQIIDNNVLNYQHHQQRNESSYDNLFEFSVMSENSIVKNYELNFNLPSGDIGNMYAIQGMSSQDQLFPSSAILDTLLTAEELQDLEEEDRHIMYHPDIGNYRWKKIQSDFMYSQYLDNVYNRVHELIGMGDKNWRTPGESYNYSINYSLLSNPDNNEKSSKTIAQNPNTTKKNHSKILSDNVEMVQAGGYLIADDIDTYYRYKATGEFFRKHRPTPLPYELILTIEGISSLLPGDVFKVDYLPKRYKNSVFFQVIKVSHNINPDGWYTTLETQFRIRGDKKSMITKFFKPVDIHLHPSLVDKFKTGMGGL